MPAFGTGCLHYSLAINDRCLTVVTCKELFVAEVGLAGKLYLTVG
jgi:hypothetical protein